MEVTLSALVAQPRLAVSRQLANWLLCWILLPNLAFASLWFVGGPPRYPEILATGVVGLIVRRSSFALKYGAFVATLAYSVLTFISAMFNLAIASVFLSIEFMMELRPSASLEYVVVALLLVATLAAAWRLLKLPTAFELPWEVIAAAAAICSVAGLDEWISHGSRGSYKRLAPNGTPFSSASSQTRFGAAPTQRNLLLIVVESMGLPREAALRQRLLSVWQRPEIADRYSFDFGSTPYFGSTTTGEIRELCGVWGDYPAFKDGRHACLPARLAERGYRTTAVHSFAGDFFDRLQWYPNVGFQRQLFRDDLFAAGASGCSGVFPGACDRDVPPILAHQLKQEGKQFVYWLTVNTHLPVPIDGSLRTGDCARFDANLADAHPMSCRMFSLWNQLSAKLAVLLSDPSLPPMDILIVGDHAPPFFDANERALYDPEHVPWIMLRQRENAARRHHAPATT